MLDGHGPGIHVSHARRDMHPCFGTWPYNIGDQFVSLAIAKLLRFEHFYTIDPLAPDSDFDVINRECDVFLIRGSNFIYPGFFAKCFPVNLLRKIKIPIIYLGAGVQFKLGERPYLLPEDYESLRYIHGSCTSCSVRGPTAAELLNQGGILNVRVTGCPTVVWSGQPEIRVRKPTWENVGWTLMEAKGQLREWQYESIRTLRRRSTVLTIVAQGGEVVLQEYVLCRDGHVTEARHDEAISSTLTKSARTIKSCSKLAGTVAYYYRDAPPEVQDDLLNRSFFSNRVPDYLNLLGSLSFVCGARLHGNIMALCQGVPTMFAVHDARLKEMAEILRVPSIYVSQSTGDVELDENAWRPFEAAYEELFATFVKFCDENGLAHSLQQSVQALA